MYRDALYKLNFYKTQIMQELTRKGIYPDDISVHLKLDRINTRLSIFQQTAALPATTFETEAFNKDIACILADLEILYRLVYELAIEEYVALQSYLQCHLNDLQQQAQNCLYKTKFEVGGTALGKTILLKTNGFNITTDNSLITVNLGSIKVKQGSKLACLFEGEDIAYKDVIFSFDGSNCSPYAYNADFFKVPGDIRCISHNYILPDDALVNSSFVLNIADFSPQKAHEYLVFSGYEKMRFHSTSISEELITKEVSNACTIKNAGFVEFYIYDGSYINFNFSKQPLKANFSGSAIEGLAKRHKITLEVERNFSFDFITDGKIFAAKDQAYIAMDKLFFPHPTKAKDFLIEEFMPGEEIVYENVSVIIRNSTDKPLNIKAIAIKELSQMEVMLKP